MKSVIVIPARLESTRLPRKLLLNMGGKSVLRHTWDQCCKVQSVNRVVVATDSAEIEAEVKSWGGEVIITSTSCRSGTERIGEALQDLDAEFILNVQGDEPFIDPELLEAIIKRASETNCDLITAVSRIRDLDELFNENVVKAVRSNDGRAVFFTRSPCPFVRGVSRADWLDKAPYYRHIGVYGYKREVVEWYQTAEPSILEQMELLEQLRFIDQGWDFQTVETDYAPVGIDTAEDLQKGIARLAGIASHVTGSPSLSDHYDIARKTVYLEIEALEHVLIRNRHAIEQAVELILGCTGKVVVAGIGKSGIIGHKIAATLASTGTPAVYLNAGEALHGDLGVVAPNDVVVPISNSAATPELTNMLPSIKQIGARMVGMLGKRDTPLAAACDVILDVGVEREACPLGLAPMSSSTVALVMGDGLAAALMQARNFTADNFALYHPGGSLGRRLLLKVSDVMHSGANDTPEVTPNTPIKDALKEMSAVNLGGIVITEKKRILGVFTDGDLRRRIVEGCSLDQPIANVMTRDPITVSASMRLGEVLDLMESTSRKVYFVPVADENGLLCGALRMHDVVGR